MTETQPNMNQSLQSVLITAAVNAVAIINN